MNINLLTDTSFIVSVLHLEESGYKFARPALEEGSAFAAWVGGRVDDILCEQFDRTVGKDNCVRFE
jgi:hypothetical protein